jgi:hypothetical protein
LLSTLKAKGVNAVAWSQLSIRNNMYLYLFAPSLRAANAIIKPGGTCDEWKAQAARGGTTLATLLNDANVEVSKTKLPEYKELRALQERYKTVCQTPSGDD